jgi:hypothetical protein
VKIRTFALPLALVCSALVGTGGVATATPLASAAVTAGDTYSWSAVHPPIAPSTRAQPQMGYDPDLSEVVLFGGYDPHVFADGDTWVYRAGVWTDLTPKLSVAPHARWGAGFAYDPALHAMVLFGGRDVGQFFQDTWTFDRSGWHRIATSVEPSPRMGTAFSFDPADNYLLDIGGAIGNLPAGSYSPWPVYNDTWALEGTTWRHLGSAPFAGACTWSGTDRTGTCSCRGNRRTSTAK